MALVPWPMVRGELRRWRSASLRVGACRSRGWGEVGVDMGGGSGGLKTPGVSLRLMVASLGVIANTRCLGRVSARLR
jgi:hypothetical protein